MFIFNTFDTETEKVTNENGDSVKIPVTLDMEGNGTGTWTVAPWSQATFTYSTCVPEVRTPATALV